MMNKLWIASAPSALLAFAATIAQGGAPGPEPDTVIALHDHLGNVVATDDNSSLAGNGLASGLFNIGVGSGFADDGSALSIRAIITGSPDGLDGSFNGLAEGGGFVLNTPHGQLGRFKVFVDFYDAGGSILASSNYTNEFISGSDAFFVNFFVPVGTSFAELYIDNQIGIPCNGADINGDGAVDAADLGILLGAFGLSCAP